MQQAAVQPKTFEQLQRQIVALEYQLARTKNPYPLARKIKKLKQQQDLINRWNYLAK
jgi:cell division protein FtsB